jgi:hypothetical protein
MDKRIIGFAAAAIVIGGAVLYAEFWIVGLFALQAGPTTPHDITRSALELRGLWHGLLWFWSLPSALGALLIACFKPRRWALYSVCAVAPGVLEEIWGAVRVAQNGIPVGYQLFSAAIGLSLLPLFLGLYYALIRRHTAV